MKKIEVLVPKLINAQDLKKLAKNLKKQNAEMKDFISRREETAFQNCMRNVTILLHKRLYWTSTRPMWPMHVDTPCSMSGIRENVLTRVKETLDRQGYKTELLAERNSYSGVSLKLLVTGLK